MSGLGEGLGRVWGESFVFVVRWGRGALDEFT